MYEDETMEEEYVPPIEDRWWNGPLKRSCSGSWFRTVYCMKPDRGKKSSPAVFSDGSINYGRQWGIEGCLRCEARVRLKEKELRIKKHGVDTIVRLSESKLDSNARLRCAWFRQWASTYPGELLKLLKQERAKIDAWRELGKIRTNWLDNNINKFLYETERVRCPFCVFPVMSPPGEEDFSLSAYYQDFESLVRHVNEWHGLTRVLRQGRGINKRWMIVPNGDEPYSYNLPVKVVQSVPLEDLFGESDGEELKLNPRTERRKGRLYRDDLAGLLE